MNKLGNEIFVEVHVEQCIFHPTENFILLEQKESKSLRTQHQVIVETKMRKSQKVIKIENFELEIRSYSK